MNAPTPQHEWVVDGEEPVRVIESGFHPPKSKFKRLRTYLQLLTIGQRHTAVGAMAEEPPRFPSFARACDVTFRFVDPVPLGEGQLYRFKLWEQGRSFAQQAFRMKGDAEVSEVKFRVCRPNQPTTRCWVTIEEFQDGCSDDRRSGAVMIKG